MNKAWVVVACAAALGVGAFWLVGPSGAMGKPAPDFSLYPGGGARPVTLSNLRGKVVVLDFWASWCPPCRAAIPAMQRLHERYADRGVVVLGVNVRDEVNPRDFLDSMGARYTSLMDGEGVAEAYGVRGIPTLVVIDAEGKVVFKEAGWSPAYEAKMAGVIEGLLAR